MYFLCVTDEIDSSPVKVKSWGDCEYAIGFWTNPESELAAKPNASVTTLYIFVGTVSLVAEFVIQTNGYIFFFLPYSKRCLFARLFFCFWGKIVDRILMNYEDSVQSYFLWRFGTLLKKLSKDSVYFLVMFSPFKDMLFTWTLSDNKVAFSKGQNYRSSDIGIWFSPQSIMINLKAIRWALRLSKAHKAHLVHKVTAVSLVIPFWKLHRR